MDEYSKFTDEELGSEYKQLLIDKKAKLREIDNIDTEIIGIREEVRRRQEKGFLEKTCPNAFIPG
jgi:hypothetical protein